MVEKILDITLGAPQAGRPVPVRRDLYVRRFLSVSHLLVKSCFERIDLHYAEDEIDTSAAVVYCNHPSFWDPLMCALATRYLFPQHHVFAPIEEEALRRFWFFQGLGFFPVRVGTVKGLRSFLNIGRAVLENVERPCLTLTPEGHFTEPSQRPIRLQRGLARLLKTVVERSVAVYPLAIDYRMQQNVRPVAFLQLGTPLVLEPDTPRDEAHLHSTLESQLETTMNKNLARIQKKYVGTNLIRSTPPT